MNGLDLEALERWADARQTSMEIAKAIFDIAETDDDAHRIWEDPTEDEMTKVMTTAWRDFADDDTTTLHWGIERIHRA